MKKRFLAALLSFAMVFAMLPVTAFAAGGSTLDDGTEDMVGIGEEDGEDLDDEDSGVSNAGSSDESTGGNASNEGASDADEDKSNNAEDTDADNDSNADLAADETTTPTFTAVFFADGDKANKYNISTDGNATDSEGSTVIVKAKGLNESFTYAMTLEHPTGAPFKTATDAFTAATGTDSTGTNAEQVTEKSFGDLTLTSEEKDKSIGFIGSLRNWKGSDNEGKYELKDGLKDGQIFKANLYKKNTSSDGSTSSSPAYTLVTSTSFELKKVTIDFGRALVTGETASSIIFQHEDKSGQTPDAFFDKVEGEERKVTIFADTAHLTNAETDPLTALQTLITFEKDGIKYYDDKGTEQTHSATEDGGAKVDKETPYTKNGRWTYTDSTGTFLFEPFIPVTAKSEDSNISVTPDTLAKPNDDGAWTFDVSAKSGYIPKATDVTFALKTAATDSADAVWTGTLASDKVDATNSIEVSAAAALSVAVDANETMIEKVSDPVELTTNETEISVTLKASDSAIYKVVATGDDAALVFTQDKTNKNVWTAKITPTAATSPKTVTVKTIELVPDLTENSVKAVIPAETETGKEGTVTLTGPEGSALYIYTGTGTPERPEKGSEVDTTKYTKYDATAAEPFKAKKDDTLYIAVVTETAASGDTPASKKVTAWGEVIVALAGTKVTLTTKDTENVTLPTTVEITLEAGKDATFEVTVKDGLQPKATGVTFKKGDAGTTQGTTIWTGTIAKDSITESKEIEISTEKEDSEPAAIAELTAKATRNSGAENTADTIKLEVTAADNKPVTTFVYKTSAKEFEKPEADATGYEDYDSTKGFTYTDGEDYVAVAVVDADGKITAWGTAVIPKADATVQTAPKVEGEAGKKTATAEPEKKDVDTALEAAKQDTSDDPSATLDFTKDKDGKPVETTENAVVKIPAESIDELAEHNKDKEEDKRVSVEVKTPAGDVTASADVLGEIAAADDGTGKLDDAEKATASTKVVLTIEKTTSEATENKPGSEAFEIKFEKITTYTDSEGKTATKETTVTVNKSVSVSVPTSLTPKPEIGKLFAYFQAATDKLEFAGMATKKGTRAEFVAPHLSTYVLFEEDQTPGQVGISIITTTESGETQEEIAFEASETDPKKFTAERTGEKIQLGGTGLDSLTVTYENTKATYKDGLFSLNAGVDSASITFTRVADGTTYTLTLNRSSGTTDPTVKTLKVTAKAMKMAGVPTHQKLSVDGAKTDGSRYVFRVKFAKLDESFGWFMFTSEEGSIIVPHDKDGYTVEAYEIPAEFTDELIENGDVADAADAAKTGYMKESHIAADLK